MANMVGSTGRDEAASSSIDDALQTGWGGVRARWPLLLGCQIVLLVAVAMAWFVALRVTDVARVDFGIGIGEWVRRPVLAIALVPAAMLGAVYVFVALRVIRGETVRVRDLIGCVRRLPALLLAGTVPLLAVAGILLVTLTLSGATLAIGLGNMGAVLSGGTVPLAATIAVLSAIFAVNLGAGVVLVTLVLTGCSQAPLLVLDQGQGGVAALKSSWSMTQGSRLRLTSLAVVSIALVIVGLALFGVGIILTATIALAAHAALYERLRTDPGSIAAERVQRAWTSWLVDGILAGWLAMSVSSIILSWATPRIVDWSRETWAPNGISLLRLPFLLPALVVLAAYALVSVLFGRPGRLILGAGWGRWSWLALGLVPVVLFLVRAVVFVPDALNSIDALAVGHEIGRLVTEDLPTGYGRRRVASPDSDWFDAMGIVNDQVGWLGVDYVITDPAGAACDFRLVTYYRPETAGEVAARLAGPSPELVTGSVTEPAARVVAPRDVPAGRTRLVILAGMTVLAGEADARDLATLRRLAAQQLGRLELARRQVARAYDQLPKGPQRLRPLEP